MKHAEVVAIVHNVADSLACGMGFLIGLYETDVYAETAKSASGKLTVDFRNGLIAEGTGSQKLGVAVALYRDALRVLLENAGGSFDDIAEASACYWIDGVTSGFTVMVTDCRGRRSSTDYAGSTSRRVVVLDTLGRRRPKPSVVTRS